MPTEREVQDEIRKLRAELGIQSESEVQAEIATLQQELSALPETFEEFTVRRQKEKERPFTEDITAFGSTLGEGLGMIAGQAKDFASELITRGLPVFTAGKVATDTGYLGGHDFARHAKTIGGAVMDKTYSEDEEIQREYERYLQNHDYNTKVRPAMLDKVENRAITDFAANLVDPTLAFPVAGVASKMGSVTAKGLQKAATAGAMATRSQGLVKTARAAEGVAKGLGTTAKAIEKTGEVMALPTVLAALAGRKALKGAALGGSLAAKGVALAGETTAKVAGTPRKLIAAAASKVVPAEMKDLAGASAFGGQLVGAMTGAVPGAAGLGIAEAAGFVAGKVGRSVESVFTSLSQRGGNGRFLYRLATNEAASLPIRRAAMWAYTHAGTRLGDAAFNMAVNGASVGALNAALAWAADEPAEGMGAAAGAGALMGGVMPFGQPGLKGGKSQGARDATSIENHIRNKVVADQRASFLKMPKASQLMIATLNEANVGAPKVVVLPKDVYLETFPDTSANYSIQERKIYVNEGRLKKGSQQAVELMAHEVGHDYVHQSLGNDPAMLRILLEPYETTADKGEAFYFQFDKAGNPIGEPIYLDETASGIRTDYDRRFPQGEGGIGTNASTLAQEIGADYFSMMFSENPNAFDHFHPRLRRHLIDGLRRFLTATGQAEPLTGNPLTNTVSKQLHRNPAIERLYRNYGKARSFELIEKGNQAEAGLVIEPRKGQTGEDRFTELFGGVGLSLKEGKNLRVTDKALFRELERIQERYRDDAPQGWKVTKQGWLTGKVLPDELRTIFTRNDRFGNVANILDALQESLSQRFGVRFGYRSGTKGKYQNPFEIRDVGLYAWMVSPVKFSGGASSKRQTRPTLKVVGYDEAKVRHNIQVLVEKKYVKDPQKFMADLATQAQKALDDPEGRINPEGRKENELFTVAFGLKESADQIASPGLKELLDSKAVKKTFVSYDIEALAGLAKGRDSAFAFDYDNIRENYSPFFSTREFMPQGDNLYMPATPESLDVVQATDKDGNPKVRPKKDSKGELVPGEFVPVYESINYDLLDSPFIESYSQPSRGRPSADFDFDALDYDVTGPKREQILKAARSGALDAAADKVVSEYNRMVTDEQVAAGSGWYARMREKIAKALGDKAEFFAQLLGATSAQTPVEENFNQAYEAMTLARQGKYDSMVKRYLEMLDLVRRGKIEEVARKRGVVRLKDIKGKSKADRIKFIQNRWVERYNLIPLRSNGKKYNANSMAVMKVLAGVWLQTTKSPKTKNFSGNLSGRTIEATIDVWAARLLRRLLYDGQEKWRIQPASETGVSNHDFAVSQIIFRKAADKLNINPDDLQAIVWFGEKGVWDTNGWTGEVGAYKSSFDEPFDVYFPEGQKPRSMTEGQNIISFLRTERRVDKGRDMVDNPGRFGKTPDEANKFLRKGVNDAKKARTGRGVEAFLRKRRRTAGR
jgi:hypothetical protein